NNMNHLIAMFFGIIGSIQLHLAKALQSQGVRTLELVRLKTNGSDAEKLRYDGKIHKSRHYLAGLLLSNSCFIWIILANRFAPSSYFTSMFGIGLIFLIIYADKVMGEEVSAGVYKGSIILLIGTLIIGYDGIMHDNITMKNINYTIVIVTAAAFFLLTTLFMIFTPTRKKEILTIGSAFLAGSLSCFDPILKGLGQHKGGQAGFLPSNSTGWILFASSLIFTTYAFIVTQWSFSHKARISIFVPVFNSAYIILPLILFRVALPGYHFSHLTIWGLLMIIAAMFYLTREIRNGKIMKAQNLQKNITSPKF
ncbi:MAG: hypothetical protein APR54_09485, partial [Candidatus Cloacimonas sp. SDB]